MDLAGRTLGKYRIEQELGRGGMGVVYRAFQTGLDRVVALKVISSELIVEKETIARFRREARAVARLNHPGVVQVYDIDEEQGLVYLVMELIEGQGLDKVISSGVLTTEQSLRVVAEIAEALGFAHDKGIVHRDIKPGNVLVTDYGRPKVLDFGLAFFLDRDQTLTRTGVLVGSPSYMSPEQVRAKGVDSRTDIYSLGVVLYRMLCGRVPFVADNSFGLLLMHLNEPLPDPLQLNPGIGTELAGVLRRALEKNPDDRYQTMGELRDAIVTAGGLSLTAPMPVTASGKRPLPSLTGGRRPSTSWRSAPEPPASGASQEDPALNTGAATYTLHSKTASTEAAGDGSSRRAEDCLPTATDVTTPLEGPARGATAGGTKGSRGAAPLTGPAEARPRLEERGLEAAPSRTLASSGPRPQQPLPGAGVRSSGRLIAVVASILVLSGIGLAVVLRLRSGAPAASVERLDRAPAQQPTPVPAPTSGVAASETPPAVQVVPTVAPPSPTAAPTRPAPTPPPRTPTPPPPPASRGEPAAGASRPAPPEPTVAVAAASPTDGARATLQRFCLSLGPNSFAQGRSKGLPPGFGADAGPAGRSVRPDAGRIQIQFEMEPKEPVEGQIFVLRAYLANDGVLDVQVASVEETLTGSSTAFRTFRGFPPPSAVRVGTSEPVYSYEGVLSGVPTVAKVVRVTDQQGDSWTRVAELRPCER